MLKTILAQVKQYKLPSVLCIVFAAAEVVMDSAAFDSRNYR